MGKISKITESQLKMSLIESAFCHFRFVQKSFQMSPMNILIFISVECL